MGSKTTKSRVKVYAVGVLALVMGVGAAGFARDGAEASDTPPQAVLLGAENVHVVAAGNVQSGPVISGTLQPEQRATVRAEVAGAVLQTTVDVGSMVRRGDVIGRIDDLAIRDGYESARSGVRAAEGAAQVARRNVERMNALAAEGAVADRAVEDARTAALVAERQLADARTALAQAEKLLSKTTLRAPISGVVSERAVSAGDIVQAGMPLFTVVDPNSMELEASLPAEELSQVQVGAVVEFRVNGYSGALRGRVERVSPMADAVTRQVRVFISIPNADHKLVGGLFAEGRIAAAARDGLVVPVSALRPVDGSTATGEVLRVRGGAIELVRVSTGLRDERSELVELTSGVTAGDTLLVGAARTLTPGTPVQLNRPAQTARAH